MFRFQTIRHPSKSLSTEKQTDLLDQILTLNLSLSKNECFQNNWRERIDSFMADTELLDLAYDKGVLVGHYSSKQIKVVGFDITYIDTFTVHPHVQGSGLGSLMAVRILWHGLLRTRGRGFMIGSRTEAPYLAASIWAGFGQKNYYPSFRSEIPATTELVTAAESMARNMWPDCHFSPKTGVLEAAYGGQFLPTIRTRHKIVQQHFDPHVNVERGDAIIQVIWLRPGTLLWLPRYYSSVAWRLIRRSWKSSSRK